MQPYGYPPPPQVLHANMQAADDRARLSMYLGFGSLVCSMFLGVPAIVVGFMARREASPGGRTNALVGIILGFLTMLPALCFVGFMIFTTMLGTAGMAAGVANGAGDHNTNGLRLKAMFTLRDIAVAKTPAGQCPDLRALVRSGAIPASMATDPWGNAFGIDCATTGEPVVRSAGPDRQWSTSDDWWTGMTM